MILKDKMFVISELDESVKSQVPVYDVKLFRTFVDFESFVEGTPIIINTLVISAEELPFTNTNMMRFINILNSPFLRITASIIYIINEEDDKSKIVKFFEHEGIDNIVIYQGKISPRYVTDIITGKARESEEQQKYTVTYMVKAAEYLKQQSSLSYEDNENDYVTDEDELENVPDEEEPEDIIPSISEFANIYYVAGSDREERTMMVFIMAQFLSLSGRCVIIEKDVKYHRLSDYFIKSGINGLFITVNEFYNNVQEVINKIKRSQDKLIVIGAIDRVDYNYQFIFNILFSNLIGDVNYMIMECDYYDVPSGVDVIYVSANTVPEIIKTGVSIERDVDPKHTKFIGLQLNNINPVNVNTKEMLAILSIILSKNNLVGQVFKCNGIRLNEGGSAYDILSVIKAGNK